MHGILSVGHIMTTFFLVRERIVCQCRAERQSHPWVLGVIPKMLEKFQCSARMKQYRFPWLPVLLP